MFGKSTLTALILCLTLAPLGSVVGPARASPIARVPSPAATPPATTATLTLTFTPTFTKTPTPTPTAGTPPPPEDTEPPQLITFDFEPKVINTAHAAQYVTVTMRLTDDLSGVELMRPDFESSSGNQRRGGAWLAHITRVSGDEHDGTYAVPVTFPQYSEMGPWRLTELRIEDRVGNVRRVDANQMAALGFPIVLWVTTGEIHTVRLPVILRND